MAPVVHPGRLLKRELAARRLSANRMLLELIENGIEAEKRKQQEFFDLAERFRNDRARLVEAEPLVDRAFTSMMASLEEKFADDGAVAAQPA